MPTEYTDVAIRARIDDYVKEMKKLPGVSQKEIAAASKAMEKAWKLPDVDKQAAAKFGALKKGATVALGGVVGDIEDVVGALGAIGPTGAIAAVGVAGVGAAAVAAVVGLVKLTRAGRESLEALDKIGEGDLVTDEQRESVLAANDALDAMGVGSDALTVSLSAALSPALQSVAGDLTELALFLAKVVSAFDTGALSINSYSSLLATLALGPIKLVIDGSLALHRMLGTNTDAMESAAKTFDDYADSVAGNAFAIHQETQAQIDSLKPTKSVDEITKNLAKNRWEASAAARAQDEAEKALTKAYKAQLGALDKIGQIGQKANEDTLGPVERLTQAYEEQIAELNRLEDAASGVGGEHEAVEAAKADVTARYLRDREEAHRAMADAVIAIEGEITEADRAEIEKRREAADAALEAAKGDEKERAKAILNTIDMALEAVGQLVSAYEDFHQQRIDSLEDERAAEKEAWAEKVKLANSSGNAITKADKDRHRQALEANQEALAAERKKMMTAFNIAKGVAIAQAIASGAMAAMAMIPGIAIAMGPAAAGAPAVAAGIAAIATGANVAVIASQKPKFHTGFAPDEMVITKGELGGILTQRGQKALGGPQTIDAANRGDLDGGQRGGGPAVYSTVHVMDNRVMGKSVTRAVAVDNALRSEIRKMEARPVGKGHYAKRRR